MKAAAIADGPNRKRDILLAAERLFARHGYHGVSIRDIAEEAGVQIALVGYYYGRKLELYHEIFRQRAGYIVERLKRLADAVAVAPKKTLLEEIVRAFVVPPLLVADDPDGYHFLRLVARGMVDQSPEDDAPIRELFDPLAHAFIDALTAALPGTPRATMAWCYQFALGVLMHHLVDVRIERLSKGENRFGEFSSHAEFMTRFIAAGIRGACCKH